MGEMPLNCNGLAQIDPTIDFCKHNCKWVMKANSGRKPKEKQFLGKKIVQKAIKKPRNICLAIEDAHYKHITKQAMHRSIEEGIYIEPNEMIREALRKCYPVPGQSDMF
jgi:hypothetical protein